MTSAQIARLFVAVDPPQEACEQLAAWARGAVRGMGLHGGRSKVSSARVLDPGLMHVTLCFLGNRPVAEIAAIEGCLEECAMGVGELSIGTPLWLPPRRPRALAVEVRDNPEGGLSALHGALVEALARASGYEQERRRYRAHVTLARLRAGPRGALGERVLPPTPALSFTPTSVVLYRSWLSPAGASYEALATRTLIPL
ncbi:MAG TPA: RNA 2',3'-cyclic phosphodiesterase [Solirubrobacteraceae bacterium]|jgi:2'-5' RNA ligase|nr:RNA 2',3'-cyclic phosphodiesterase [Solirubrobacteraceae bacterium]